MVASSAMRAALEGRAAAGSGAVSAPSAGSLILGASGVLLVAALFVGGGADKATAGLREAIELFDAETVTDSTAPDWGRDDAHLWAGRAAMKLEDFAGAREHYHRALEINPHNGWVRNVLLPAAEKAVAARTERGKGDS